jgi:DNA-binding Lrp family transcriptional regulator
VRCRLLKFEPSVLEDRRSWLLIKDLLGGRIKELNPIIDSTSQFGFRYPEAETLLEASATETVERLQKLYSAGILEAELVDTVLLCSTCQSTDIRPKHICPHCKSNRLVHLEIIEHFPCGYIGPRETYKEIKGQFRCPSCKNLLEGEKQDHQLQNGIQCLDCKRFALEPRLLFHCFKCHNISSSTELKQQPIFKFFLNLEYRGDIIHYLGYHPEPESERLTRHKYPVKIDAIDKRILNILQADARQSFRTVARKLKVSDATIRDRITRLQKNGIIKGFTTLVDPQKVGMELICLIQLEVAPKQLSQILQNLANIGDVKLVMETTEGQNIQLLATFPSRATLNDFLNDNIRSHPNIKLHTISVAVALHKLDWKIHFD